MTERQITDARIERVAEALYTHRYGKKLGPWARFRVNHAEIAKIYRENAEVALRADIGLLTESVA